jgi:hypothetical protein
VAKATDDGTKTELLPAARHRRRDDLERTDEPPVVARLVVEIRSDGSRTIARGALEDAQRGERVAIEARGDSPMALAIALARSLSQLPRLTARSAVRGLLGKRRDK